MKVIQSSQRQGQHEIEEERPLLEGVASGFFFCLFLRQGNVDQTNLKQAPLTPLPVVLGLQASNITPGL